MRVSVVVCTYNRAASLRDTLRCLRWQEHRDLEVVVVNGPSTDDTSHVIAEVASDVKRLDNPAANLSISRNIGIRAAAGDVVAFIDDDALPERNWLTQALPAFDDPEVGAVGGIVLDHTGMRLQYRYSAANRFGEAIFSDDLPFDSWSAPGTFTFPYIQGTNALFRRSVLEEIGLFDETFDFYLDETDVCARVVDAGHVIRQLDDAAVHHRYLPSAVRNEARITTNWYPVVKNHTYFGYKHAALDRFELEVIDSARTLIDRLLDDARDHESAGRIEPGHFARSLEACGRGLREGVQLAATIEPTGPCEPLDPPAFLAYATAHTERPLKIVLVSSGYTPHLTGGIARFVSDVAPELAQLGHDVRVFTRAFEGGSRIDREGDVWVHRLELAEVPGLIPEASAPVDGFATAVAHELQRVARWWAADVVYGSLWDVELLGVARTSTVPVVPMLATPVAEVAAHEGWDQPDSPQYEAIRSLISLETDLLRSASGVHAISEAIVDTFEQLYPDTLRPAATHVAHIGRRDDAPDAADHVPASPPSVLFVGRLEPRKGIDVFLDSAALLLDRVDDVEIIIAGADDRTGPNGLTWREEWQQRGHGGRLRFVGTVDDDTLTNLMRDASVVAMPSRYESFGLVVVEAMMHGRPPVASAVGGIKELIVDGEHGYLVPVGDAAALADALERALAPGGRETGARARARFEESLTAAAAARRLVGVLNSVLDADRATSPVGATPR